MMTLDLKIFCRLIVSIVSFALAALVAMVGGG